MGDDVTILLGARDNATKVIDAVQAKLQALTTKQGLGELVAFGGFAAGASLATRALSDLAQGFEAVAAGELEVHQALLGAIPIYGQLMKAAADLRRAIDGTAEADRRLAAQFADQISRNSAGAAAAEFSRNLTGELDLRQRVAAAYDETSAAVMRLQDEERRRLEDIEREIIKLEEAGVAGARRAELEAARGEVERTITAEINKLLDDRGKKLAEASAKAAETENEKAYKRAQEVMDLDSQIAAARMRALGQEEAAEMESIRRRYESRIAQAERAGEAEKAARLRTLLNMDLEEAKKPRQKVTSSETGQLAALGSRFLSRAPGYSSSDPATKALTAAQTTAKNTGQLITRIENLTRTLERKTGERIEMGWGL